MAITPLSLGSPATRMAHFKGAAIQRKMTVYAAKGRPTKRTGNRMKPSRGKVPEGFVTIRATFNNTIVSVTDPNGDVLCWASGGSMGFKGARKSTPYAAQMAAESAAKQAMALGVKDVGIIVNGPGTGRENAIRSIPATGLNVTIIRDITPLPHNGCRPPKKRRV